MGSVGDGGDDGDGGGEGGVGVGGGIKAAAVREVRTAVGRAEWVVVVVVVAGSGGVVRPICNLVSHQLRFSHINYVFSTITCFGNIRYWLGFGTRPHAGHALVRGVVGSTPHSVTYTSPWAPTMSPKAPTHTHTHIEYLAARGPRAASVTLLLLAKRAITTRSSVTAKKLRHAFPLGYESFLNPSRRSCSHLNPI